MRGIDTNIVLRIFDRTDAKQSSAVEKLIAEAASSKDLLLNPIVLSELAWTLKRSYKKSRSVIAIALPPQGSKRRSLLARSCARPCQIST